MIKFRELWKLFNGWDCYSKVRLRDRNGNEITIYDERDNDDCELDRAMMRKVMRTYGETRVLEISVVNGIFNVYLPTSQIFNGDE